MRSRRYLVLLLVPLVVSLGMSPFSGSTSALSGSDFQATRIIDDNVFYNSGNMSALDIQAFLNSKVPVCDTDGTQPYAGTTRAAYSTSRGYPPPFICLKDYRQDTVAKTAESGLCNGYGVANQSAAEIIQGVSQSCGINARALIVLLQKEQALVTDDWPWPNQYRSATGYGCPDTAPCDTQYYGFFNQVYNAARQFKRYARDANQFNYRANRNNYVQYNPNAGCGGTNLFIQNNATAGLYNYTPYQPNASALANLYGTGDSCGAYGNRNFWRLFNDWFGSTQLSVTECDSKVSGVLCVWSLIKSDGSQFLTTSKAERDSAINNLGWIYEGVTFYASQAQQPSTTPTYRLRKDNAHYYTAVESEYNSMVSTQGWIDEGVAFYSYTANTTTNISHPVYRLYNSSLNKRYWTIDNNKKVSLINSGYSLEANVFNGFSGQANLPIPASGRLNIYRIQTLGSYFYTSSLYEMELLVRSGQSYEGLLTTANATNSGTPVYRLRRNSVYFYTSNVNERDIAVQTYGMSDEGIAFYLDGSSDQVYRVANSVGSRYLYTSSVGEVMAVANTNGWQYEGTLFSLNSSPSPVYRFLNLLNHRHFYTININEAAIITNRNWRYEGPVFNASKDSGRPVHRLRISDKHFFTADSNEKDIAISNYGYTYEGVAYFVSQTTTSKPVFRLQGNNEYFYTASAAEKDSAVNMYGYRYEGEGFYLPL